MRRSLTIVGMGVLVAAAFTPGRPIVGHAASPASTTSLVSRFDGSSGPASDQGGFSPSLSADGRFVAFESRAILTGDNTGGDLQVFVRDRKLSHDTLISRASGAGGAVANRASDAPSISADGRYVAFESRATNLIPGFIPTSRNCDDGTGQRLGDVYLRDLATDTTTLVSHATASAVMAGNGYSEDPKISADGSTISFASGATDIATDGLTDPARGCQGQVYAHKVVAGTTVMVRTHDGSVPNGEVDGYAISGNGNVVAFSTLATNVTTDTTNPSEGYTYDLTSHVDALVSRATGAAGAPADNAGGGDGHVGSVTSNSDGTLVAFNSEADNLGTAPPTCTSGASTMTCSEVYLRDTAAATTTLISKTTADDTANGDNGPAVMTSDGQTIAFESSAPNLGGSTTSTGDEVTQIIIRDQTAGTTTTVSRADGDGGAIANQGSSDPALSDDGRSVGFESLASNLSSSDTRNASQVWVRGAAFEPPPPPPPVRTGGYDLVSDDGVVYPFGSTGYGSFGARAAASRADVGERRNAVRQVQLNKPIVGIAGVPGGGGYWLVASDGGIFPFGPRAGGYGSTGGIHLNQPVVGMAPTVSGRGYWLVAADGGIFPFGDAVGYGSTGNIHLNKPIVGMAAVPGGGGYWLVASDGGIFPFGTAQGYGSLGNVHLNQPIVGMAAVPSGGGYWLVASDGGIFPFGNAGGYGSTGNVTLNRPIVGMAATADGKGYWMTATDGGIFPFGDAPGLGSLGGSPPKHPIVGITPGT